MVKSFEEIKEILEKQKYAIVGHSAVQVCQWTKNSINGKSGCWKEEFYGIESHRCCQMSPSFMWCENRCLHCWRPIEHNLGMKIPNPEKPSEIIDKIIEARKKLLIGYKGQKNADKKKVAEAFEPTLFTFSLSGEATLYPYLGEMIHELRKKEIITFLVTNGLNPEKLKELEKTNSLPTQLTISTNTSNEKLFKIWHRSLKKDAWKKFNESLVIMKKLKGKTRRVIRLTLVSEHPEKSESFIDKLSNMKDEHVKQYAKLIKIAEPNFIHVKGFKSIGYSKKRLGYKKMPWHHEVVEFAGKLAKELQKSDKKYNYKILAEDFASCVVLLGKSKKEMKIKKA